MTAILPKVEIYTDGGCSPNPGPGGWAAVLISGSSEKELMGAEAHTTNNRMELTAAVRALEALKKPCSVRLHTDSEYVKLGISEWIEKWRRNGWRTRSGPVKNQDLWQALDAAAQSHDVHWAWVRGHSGVEHNERCDRLVHEARAQFARERA